MNAHDQRELIMDWIYEEGHDYVTKWDSEFAKYWADRCGIKCGLKADRVMMVRLRELFTAGRLDRRRIDFEHERQSGIPKWTYLYS